MITPRPEKYLGHMSVILVIGVHFRILSTRVPYYAGVLKTDPTLENYPSVVSGTKGLDTTPKPNTSAETCEHNASHIVLAIGNEWILKVLHTCIYIYIHLSIVFCTYMLMCRGQMVGLGKNVWLLCSMCVSMDACMYE